MKRLYMCFIRLIYVKRKFESELTKNVLE